MFTPLSGCSMLITPSGKRTSRRPVNRSNKGNTIMGDKSPKSKNKQAGQKQSKIDKASQQKKQATAAKQVGGKVK
jgi:hypothetical protein